MPADVYEGPAMNHSYHEMIIGHGKCFSTVLIAEPNEPAFQPGHHRGVPRGAGDAGPQLDLVDDTRPRARAVHIQARGTRCEC